MTHLSSPTSSPSPNGSCGVGSGDATSSQSKLDEEGSDQEDFVRGGGGSDIIETTCRQPLTNGFKATNRVRKFAKDSFEEASLWDAFCTYVCYAFLVIVGYVNDIIRPRTTLEKNREVS